MIIHIFNKDTKMYEYSQKAQISPRENNKFIYPSNSTQITPPETSEHERAYFINNQWEVKPYYMNCYQIELATKLISIVNYEGKIKSGYQFITKEIAEDIMENPDKWDIRENQLIKLSDDEFNLLQKLHKVQNDLIEATLEYETSINTPVLYKNGFTYKPLYAKDSYETLINTENIAKSVGQTTFPQYIKDSTKLAERAVYMSYEELVELAFFLGNIAGQFWKTKANKEAELSTQKLEIEAQLNEMRI